MFLFVRSHITYLTGLALAGLALNTALNYPSAVVAHYEALGIPHIWLSGILIAGAIITLIAQSPAAFIIGTLPYAWYVVSTVYIVIDHRGGYPTAIVYLFSYFELLALYDCRNGAAHG